MERDSARGAIQPGAENPSPVFANRLGFSARPKGLENLKKISCNRNRISARAEKQETVWLPLGSKSDFSGIKPIIERILFIASLFSKNIEFSTDKVKQYDAVRKAMNLASLKIFYLSLQIRLSSWEICSQRQVTLQFHHLMGCYNPKKLKIDLRQKAKLWERQCAYFRDSCFRRHFDFPETLSAQAYSAPRLIISTRAVATIAHVLRTFVVVLEEPNEWNWCNPYRLLRSKFVYLVHSYFYRKPWLAEPETLKLGC